MKFSNFWIGFLVGAAAVSTAIAQTPVLSTLEAPYAPIQSQVQMAGNTYASGTVAYGPAGTPLVLSGSNLGDNGIVWFFAYKNGVLDTRTAPAEGLITLWTASQIFVKVPSGAVSGLVQVVAGDKVSNPLPFVVTGGTYSTSCPGGPSAGQLQITTDSLTDGTVSHSYSVQLQAKGGSNSYAWYLISGSLPSGLSLSSSGTISGTPSSASNPLSFTVQVADTSTPQQHAEATLSLEIAAQPEAGSSAALYSFSIQNSGGSAEGYDGVGNVTGYTDSVNGGPWTMSYDSLNRLATATASQDNNPNPNYCWQYDNFGNREWQTSASTPYSNSSGGGNACTAGSGPSWGASYNTSNQISGGQYAYDAAGNITSDSTTGNSYLYDGEGRICAMQQSIDGTTTMTQYIYDAEGHRVAKGSINSWSCDTTSNGFSATNVYVLDQSGNQMTEMTNPTGTWQWAHTNVFAPGLSSTYDADVTEQTEGKMYFHLSDWLGTRRQQTDYAGNPLLNFTGLPYGDGLTPIPVSNTEAADATEHHFTSKERDWESGNDYFLARYYASPTGRFLSPDDGSDQQSGDPQSWNLYSYVRNNPLANTDPDGHGCQTTFSSTFNGDPSTTTTSTIADNGNCQNSLSALEQDLYMQLADAVRTVVNTASQVAHTTANIISTPGGTRCLAATTFGGGLVGAGTGAEVGSAGLLGGPAVVVTEAAAVPTGTAIGLGSGAAFGMASCPGSGGGGGAGGSGSGGGLSPKAKQKLGNLANRAGEKVRDVIRSRGGSGANVQRVGQWADRTLGDAAKAAVEGDETAETAVKIAKQAGRLGQQY